MSKHRLVWKLFPSLLIMILIALGAATWIAAMAMHSFHERQVQYDLEVRVRLMLSQLSDSVENDGVVQRVCREMGQVGETRFTCVDLKGRVIADSQENPGDMDNHANRPEIRQAFLGGVGSSIRFSDTLQRRMVYVAVPWVSDGEVVGAVRASITLTLLSEALRSFYSDMISGAVLIAGLVALFSLWIARRLSQPLEYLREGAQRFAGGDLGHHLEEPDSHEMASLARSMNDMAAQLNERILTIVCQRNEIKAMVESMVEGVLAVDASETVISLNAAAGELLRVDVEKARGHMLPEVIRNAEILKFSKHLLANPKRTSGEIILHKPDGDCVMEIQGAPLEDVNGEGFGALLVLHDVTRLRRLEQVRKDFVANVSHELMTPITSIKGFAETLLENRDMAPQDVERFLSIIHRQANGLKAIIEDLLILSSLDSRTAAIDKFEVCAVNEVVGHAVEAAWLCIADRPGKVNVNCPDLTVRANPTLLEHAIANLLDNALKYSPKEQPVEIEVRQEENRIAIYVRDQGGGIPRESLPRLFERFYRVDKARSRSMGGTGLGLAIVKHICEVHGGDVSVESRVGRGSEFCIRIPAAI